VPRGPVTPDLVACWWCGHQAQLRPDCWPVGMVMATRDSGVVWECFDHRACLRRTVARLPGMRKAGRPLVEGFGGGTPGLYRHPRPLA